MTYRFLDGSLDEETVIYSEDRVLKLISDHHIQKGPFFSKDSDWLIESSGQVTGRTVDKDGKEKIESSHMDLQPDLANGMVGTILLNVAQNSPEFKVPYVAPMGKGRLIHLDVSPADTGTFTDVGVRHKAAIFRVKIELGGVVGAVAPVVGKQPKDLLIWVLEGEVPALVREVGQTYEGGPVVSIELSGASFATVASSTK